MRAVSGFEHRISAEISALLSPYADEVFLSASGSVIALKRGRKSDTRLMIEAHMDEIGLMVSRICEDGLLELVPIGGVDPRILPASEVIIHGREDICGIIGAKPPHLQTAEESKKSVKIKDMRIDTGRSAEEVKRVISVGDSITLSQSVGELLGGSYSGKTLDDRAGVAAVAEVLKRLDGRQLDFDLYVAAATQEEVGLRGAKTAAYEIFPHAAIAVDVCHGVTPDNSKDAFDIGSGTVISLGPNIHPKMSERLTELAEKYNIKYSIDVDGGDTGTDAWAIQITRTGIPTALLSIPLKYMHTAVETISLEDLSATAELLLRFVENFNPNTEEWLCF